MADLKAFIKKWHGRVLQDDGCYVSKEFKSFQTAFGNTMKKIAKSLNAEVVGYSKGHYDMSGFIKRGEHYVYFSYSALLLGHRSSCILKDDDNFRSCFKPLLIRTAKHERDYIGGITNFCQFNECEELIANLLDE